jgi:hemoglobin/transferrin/lactoferrin receptor protein
MSMSNTKKLLGTAICAVLCDAAFAASESAATTLQLEEVIVTGEHYAFGAKKIVTVTAEEVELTQAADLNDIFSQDPSIQVGGGLPAAQKIYIRGIEDKLLNISIDGAQQGGYLSHHHGQYLIEPELLKVVTVEPGPGGAAQGFGALGGSIRFLTKSPADFLSDGERFGAFGKASYFSNAETKRATGAVYGEVSDSLALLGAYTHSDTENYTDGNGTEVDYTTHTQSRAFAKAVASFGNGQQLSLGLERLEDDGTYRHRPNFAGYFNHPRAANVPVDMLLTRDTVTLNYAQMPNKNQGLAASAYYTDTLFDRSNQYEMGYQSLGFDVHNTHARSSHSLTYGLEFRDDTMSFTGKGASTGFSAPIVYRTINDETVRIVGVYAQDDWQVADPVQVSLSVRADNYKYQDKDSQSYQDTGVSPSVGIAYDVFTGLQLNASYGFAFRGVTVIDAITSNEGGIRNNIDIDAEKARNAEVGFQYDYGVMFVAGTYYRQKISDLILDFNGDGVRGNEGELQVNGYDLSVGANVSSLTASIAMSEADSELNDADLVDTNFGIGASIGRAWTANVGYRFDAIRLQLGWTTQYVEAFLNAPANAPNAALFNKPAYAVHGAYVQWLPLASTRLSVTLTGANLFDKFYVDQATSGYNSQLQRVAGLPAMGRDVRVSVAYRF